MVSVGGSFDLMQTLKDITDWEADRTGKMHTFLKIVRDMDSFWQGVCVCVCQSNTSVSLTFNDYKHALYNTATHFNSHEHKLLKTP